MGGLSANSVRSQKNSHDANLILSVLMLWIDTFAAVHISCTKLTNLMSGLWFLSANIVPIFKFRIVTFTFSDQMALSATCGGQI